MKIPAKIIFEEDSIFELAILLIKLKTEEGFAYANMELIYSMLGYSRNKRERSLELFSKFLKDSFEDKLIKYNVNQLYEYKNGVIVNYIKISKREIELINDIKLLRYYCFLVYNEQLDNSHCQTTISTLYNASRTTIVKYNKTLKEKGLINWTNAYSTRDRLTTNEYMFPHRTS
jgi:hypothetical protein